MRKSIYLIIMCTMVVLVVGCGKNQRVGTNEQLEDLKDDDTFSEIEPVEPGAGKTGIITDESEKEEILQEIQKGSLNVENDAFEFENMTSYVGKPEVELITLIGAEDHPDEYATKLFGEDVSISVSTDKENVSEIRLLFSDTDKELLINAIGEQLGTDPEEVEDVLEWTYLGKIIQLEDLEEGILVTVTAEG